MKILQEIKGMDIYLLDQLMKGTFAPNHRILDAGCGTGRNLRYFMNNDFNIVGIDTNASCITDLQSIYSKQGSHFINSSIEDFKDPTEFDAIICNAVLHFAKNHDHFDRMFAKLIELLKSNGILFIRMTSDIGLNLSDSSEGGVYRLPDQSFRYLITEDKIEALLKEYSLRLKEPIKTVNVNNLRCMTTLVMEKSPNTYVRTEGIGNSLTIGI